MGLHYEGIEIKRAKLKRELAKPKSLQNKYQIQRLVESIERNKKIGYKKAQWRRKIKQDKLKKKK